MSRITRILFVLTCFTSGTLAAQQSTEQMRAAAFTGAERYVNCLMNLNLLCVDEMTPPVHPVILERQLLWREAVMSRSRDYYHRLEVAQPWPPMAAGEELFVIVPTFEVAADVSVGFRMEIMSYLVGSSVDGGASWRFIWYDSYSGPSPSVIDLVSEFLGDLPPPEALLVCMPEMPYVRSRWLATTQRGFIADEDKYAYAMKFAFRQEVENPVDLAVRYDNPADPAHSAEQRGLLERGQRELELHSAALSGFEMGETYEVVIEGRDPDTGRRLFEHREKLYFMPTRDLWLSVLSKPLSESPQLREELLAMLAPREGCVLPLRRDLGPDPIYPLQ